MEEGVALMDEEEGSDEGQDYLGSNVDKDDRPGEVQCKDTR